MRKARRKLLPALLLCGVLALAGIGGGYAFTRPNTAYAQSDAQAATVLPIEPQSVNVARGKTAEMRSLTDFSQTLPVYSYYPDGAATVFPDVEGSGQHALSDTAALTDGEANDWTGYKARSTAPGTRGWVYLDLGKTTVLEKIKLHMCAAWVFWDVIVQVSDDANFAAGVTTLFSTVDSLAVDGTTVYDGGKIGLSTATKALTGWNGGAGVDSYMSPSANTDGNVFACEGISARYVRVTDNSLGSGHGQGGATYETVFTEVEVYAVEKGLPPAASLESGYHINLGSVTLSSAYPDAQIYYTLDGSYPTVNSTRYTGAIDLSEVKTQCVLRAIVATDEWQSKPVEYQYKTGAYVPADQNVAQGKPFEFRDLADVTKKLDAYAFVCEGSGVFPLEEASNGIDTVTDGSAGDFAQKTALATNVKVQGWGYIDLGGSYELSSVKLHLYAWWNFFDLLIQVSDDPTFATGVTTVFSAVESLYPRNNGVAVKDGDPVYADGYVGTDAVELAEWAGIGKYGDNNGKYLVSDQANGHEFACPAGTKGRYVRVTNRILGDFHGQGNSNTVFSEIKVYTSAASTTPSNLPVKEAVKSNDYRTKAVNVPYNTTLAAAKEALGLPASMTLTDYSGGSYNVSLDWTDPANYNQTTPDTYTFTASYTLPAGVTDVFGLLGELKATVTLAERTDVTELEAAIDEAEALAEADYTAASWATVQEKLAAAKEAAENLSVTPEEAATALKDLEDAVKALVRIASAQEKAALKEVIDEAAALDTTQYTAASLTGLADALTAANTVYETAEVSSARVTEAKTAVEKILAGKKEKATAAQTEALTALVTTVKAANYSADGYTQATVVAVEDALEAAETLLSGSDLAAEDVAAAKSALEKAVEALVAYGNAAQLNAAIAAAKEKAAADYTASSFDALTAAITKAEGVAAIKRVQSEYDTAKEELQAAEDALVSVVALKAAIAAAVPEEGKEYTALSLQILNEAKAEAQNVLKKADATADELAAAVTKLNAAKAGLALKPELPPEDEDNKGNTTQEGGKKKGCKGSLGATCGALGALLLCGAAVVLGRKKKSEEKGE